MFYMRNLSMLGTHAALLAGFAFTILSQHEFKTPPQGFLSYEDEVWLQMWPDNSTVINGDHDPRINEIHVASIAFPGQGI